ncbi:uncharacterized protein BXZ73DRAFT_84509 [Epithele typhae]|uniref:uncharacterized protein n=1 Tax=Epithele typhae TaxID=378194 RepID=UPI002008D2A5|nr:uncharacterized protein BXZ73DRAFT_84509 [Epithele typhae]KAH9907680.1 hypothetical protein BXZ73DRAFT_84509 [Epithele typhae]
MLLLCGAHYPVVPVSRLQTLGGSTSGRLRYDERPLRLPVVRTARTYRVLAMSAPLHPQAPHGVNHGPQVDAWARVVVLPIPRHQFFFSPRSLLLLLRPPLSQPPSASTIESSFPSSPSIASLTSTSIAVSTAPLRGSKLKDYESAFGTLQSQYGLASPTPSPLASPRSKSPSWLKRALGWPSLEPHAQVKTRAATDDGG